jgi:hypothetical protein
LTPSPCAVPGTTRWRRAAGQPAWTPHRTVRSGSGLGRRGSCWSDPCWCLARGGPATGCRRAPRADDPTPRERAGRPSLGRSTACGLSRHHDPTWPQVGMANARATSASTDRVGVLA